jgi:peptidyl-prolyl cis-trans isomerase A (cyclophilin A)
MKRRDVLIGLGGMAATPALAQIGAPATTPPAGAAAPTAPPGAGAAGSTLATPTPTTVGARPAAAPTTAPAAPAAGTAPGATAVAAPTAPSGPPPLTPGAVRVAIRTAQGTILVDLFRDKAPITVANFLKYVDGKHFDGASFYRASHPGDDPNWGTLQGGLQNKMRAPFPPIAHESSAKTGIKHLDGTISMTRNAPGTATSDFFINMGNQDAFDSKPGDPGYAGFGRVVSGIEIAKKILYMPRSRTAGVGFMKGEMLSPPVTITSIRRVAAPR